MERIIKMNVLNRKTTASIVLLSVALLVCSMFQTVGNAADTKLNISECGIKDKTLSYTGNISEGEIFPFLRVPCNDIPAIHGETER